MYKDFRLWIKSAMVAQWLTAIFHAFGFLVERIPKDKLEQQMMHLNKTYKMDMGGGFLRTHDQLFNAVSIGFSMLFLLAGLLNWHLLKQNSPRNIWKGVVIIQLGVFGLMAVELFFFSFLPPLVGASLITVLLALALKEILLAKQQ